MIKIVENEITYNLSKRRCSSKLAQGIFHECNYLYLVYDAIGLWYFKATTLLVLINVLNLLSYQAN